MIRQCLVQKGGVAFIKAIRETDIVRQCLDWLALHRIMAWRSNNTGVYDPGRKAFRSFRGLKGVSDILGIVPVCRRLVMMGQFLAVEVKRPSGALSEDQKDFLMRIENAGGIALCVHSVGELEMGLDPYLNQKGDRR